MARHTTLRVGGPAEVWVQPANEADLGATLRLAWEHAVPVLLLGRGSNLLVRDGGVRGVVVHLGHEGFSTVAVEGALLRCGAGARLKAVAIEARRHALAGLEFLEGIPGSVGGALRMNAGAHGGAICEVLVEVRLMDLNGQARVVPAADLRAEYRSSPLLRNHVAIQAVLRGVPDESSAIEQRMQSFNERRWASQPAAPSAGCVFKNPATIPAGRLVDELGLKGTVIGAARVAQEHGNFIVTSPGARSADVLALIALIRERALNERGIQLETEVQIVGDEA
jgi:UDP-N-acetylenolpyruvoylglucosamine reductase